MRTKAFQSTFFALLISFVCLSSAGEEPYFSIIDNPVSYWIVDWSYTFPFDFNHDGFVDMIHSDLLLPTYDPSPLRAFQSDGQGHFNEVTPYVFPGNPMIQGSLENFVADYNGDGLPDLFICALGPDLPPRPGEKNKIFFQTAGGRLLDKSAERLPNLQSVTLSAESADIDGDGDIDIFVGNGGGIDGRPYLLINDGSGHFTKTTAGLPSYLTVVDSNPISRWPTYSAFLDVNKDGHPDLVIGWPGRGMGGGTFYPHDTILMNDGNGNFTEAPEDTLPLRRNGQNWSAYFMRCRDFNGDGWTDILNLVTEDAVQDDFQFQLLLNNKDGTFSDFSTNLPQNFGPTTGIQGRLSIVDFNNDGWLDIYHSGDGPGGPGNSVNRIYMNRGRAFFTESFQKMVPGAPIFVGGAAADFDNDGDPDIFGRHQTHLYVLKNLRPFVTAVPLPYPNAPVPASPSDGALADSLTPLLTWNEVGTALDYDIQIATNTGFSLLIEKRSHRTTNTYVPRNLSWNTAYFWRVKAYNTRGASSWSGTYSFTTPLSIFAPVNAALQRITVDYGFFKVYTNRLTWQANPQSMATVTSFRIYRKPKDAAESDWAFLVELPGTTLTYDHRGLRNEELFTYQITAISSQGVESDPATIGN